MRTSTERPDVKGARALDAVPRGATPRVLRLVGRFVGLAVVAAVIAAPVAAERAVEGVRFTDRLGLVPVTVSLSHNGVSTLDTGILGQLYWDRTGAGGMGAFVRVTGPPDAGGSLSSYVSPAFVKANAQFVSDPGETARAYGVKLRRQLSWRFLLLELGAGLVGGALLMVLLRGGVAVPADMSPLTRTGLGVLALVLALASSGAAATWLFGRWAGSTEPDRTFAIPAIGELSFSSPEALEVARQVEPFIVKNTHRIRDRADAYASAAEEALREAVPLHADALAPRDGERILVAEADPQGSLVGTRVRTALYSLLQQHLPDDALALRTISGDVTSNGTVAEAGFVEDESRAGGDIPVVAVKGDHDTDTTVEQLLEADVLNPDLDVAEVAGLQVVGGNDPAFKALFGGLVINETGISETELGARLRDDVVAGRDGHSLVVLLHQPSSAAGYVGVSDLGELGGAVGRETVPWDDGIPDLPPGIINVGHLHDAEPPKVIWNTDTDVVTWTVLNQLGTSGGVEENPTFNRFSTPFSAPLKRLSMQLQYLDTETGLQTGYASIDIATDGSVTITDRADLGLARAGAEDLRRRQVACGDGDCAVGHVG